MAKRKKAKKNPLIRKGKSAAKAANKQAGSSKLAKKSKAASGIGKKVQTPKEATAKDIRRKGISAIKGANSALARFIAIRYSAKAIAKYQDYGLRLRRSKRLQGQVVKIDDATYRIKGYIIRTSTDGLTPYSCTCPDFSQFSNDDRNWLGSKAGPFNPCKHMMAVRDRNRLRRGCTDPAAINYDPTALEDDGSCFYTWGWECLGGECYETEGFFGTYPTQEACLAARVKDYPPPAAGQNCIILITSNVSVTTPDGTFTQIYTEEPTLNINGLLYICQDFTGYSTETINNPGLPGDIGDRAVVVKGSYKIGAASYTDQPIAYIQKKNVLTFFPENDWTINSLVVQIVALDPDGLPIINYSCPI